MQAMILAAGFGTRLLPHTRVRPKPLFPLFNRPLLLLNIQRLRRLGFSRIVINCHHLAEQIEAAVAGLEDAGDIVIQREEEILGTGGGLRRAVESLAPGPVLVTNADIYHTVDFTWLWQQHLAGDGRISLAMHDCPRFNTVRCVGDRVTGFGLYGESLAFTGIHVVDRSVLEEITEPDYSCIIDHYRSLLEAGEKITALRPDRRENFYWTDIGTPADYLALHAEMLAGKVPLWQELSEAVQHPVAAGAQVAEALLEGWNVIGRATLGRGSTVVDSVIWDGVEVAEGSTIRGRLLSGVESDAAMIELAQDLLVQAGRPMSEKSSIQALAADGSSRRFWQLGEMVAVVPEGWSKAEMKEAAACWHIGRHLAAQGCSVPQPFGYDSPTGLVVMENLGSTSLYDEVQRLRPAGEAALLPLYSKVLERLVQLQVDGAEGFELQWCWDTPLYDKDLMLERESDYFLNAFWCGLLEQQAPDGIAAEFSTLADCAAEVEPACFLHRDCQSRNIMVQEGEPFFIDFQGGRLGPPGYDVASLLLDPYAALSPQLQDELVTRYYHLLAKKAPKQAGTQESFLRSYNALALQRNLQILGAFAFLSRERDKPFFKRFLLPAGASLATRLQGAQFLHLALLRGMAAQAVTMLQERAEYSSGEDHGR